MKGQTMFTIGDAINATTISKSINGKGMLFKRLTAENRYCVMYEQYPLGSGWTCLKGFVSDGNFCCESGMRFSTYYACKEWFDSASL
jgi:hypothetical protein